MGLLSNKEFTIINLIISKNKMTVSKLAKELDCSEMTIRNSLKKIDNFLTENNFNNLEKEKKAYKLNLDLKDFEKIFSSMSIDSNSKFSPTERLEYIILNLVLFNKVTLSEIARTFDVTRQTIFNDISEIKKFLVGFNLELESITSKGLFLKGDSMDITLFCIKFLSKRFLEKEFNPYAENLYLSAVNPNFFNLFRTVVSKEKEEVLVSFIKEISENLSFFIGSYYYSGMISVLTYMITKRNTVINSTFNINNFPIETQEIYNKYLSLIKSCPSYKDLKFLDKNIFLLIIMLMKRDINHINCSLFFDPRVFEFIQRLEKHFNLKFVPGDKVILIDMLENAIFKSEFKIISKHIDKKFIKNKSLEIYNGIQAIADEVIPNILDDDIMLLTIFCTKIIKLSSMPKKNIYILDRSMNNWLGERIKAELKENYLVENIQVSSMFSKIDWKHINKTYETLIFINKSIYDESKIEIEHYSVNAYEIFKDPFYFEKYGFEKKK